jgi:CRP-like cAMP-binding protein
MTSLPASLRTQVMTEVYPDLDITYPFLAKIQPVNHGRLTTWLRANLMPAEFKAHEDVFCENEPINCFYFVQKGSVSYVLPRFADAVFSKLDQGSVFGLEDFFYNVVTDGLDLFNGDFNVELFEADDYGLRRFAVTTNCSTTLMKLSLLDFKKMLIEFADFSEKLMVQALEQLQTLIDKKCKTTILLDPQMKDEQFKVSRLDSE